MRERVLYFYLNPRQRAQVEAREGKILSSVVAVVEAAGWRVVLLPEEARLAASGVDGYHLVLNREVPGPYCLSLRQCYMEPFWRIDATNDRWDWETSRLTFDASKVRAPNVGAFFQRWQRNLFGSAAITREGFLFAPLQGKLLRHRSFQSMSPVEMLEATLAQDQRPLIATLHPSEVYTEDERAALTALQAREPRFAISTEPSIDLLRRCDGVVTQNSTMAVTGYFAQKPAVLFARADFHHIAGSVMRDGMLAAFGRMQRDAPYPAYLFWFFKMNAITSWSDEVQTQIASRLRSHGWPV
ncbi:MAG: hypothetical protein ACRC14_14755 [Paracoccaceae bacterium]